MSLNKSWIFFVVKCYPHYIRNEKNLPQRKLFQTIPNCVWMRYLAKVWYCIIVSYGKRIYFIRICPKHITIIDVRYQFGHKLPKVDHCDINDFFALRSWPYFNWLHNTHATLDFIQKMISCKYQITIPLIIT